MALNRYIPVLYVPHPRARPEIQLNWRTCTFCGPVEEDETYIKEEGAWKLVGRVRLQRGGFPEHTLLPTVLPNLEPATCSSGATVAAAVAVSAKQQ